MDKLGNENFGTSVEVVSKESIGGSLLSQKLIKDIVIGVLVVLFIGFATMFVAVAAMFVSAWNSKQASYEELTTQITQQNAKIDLLYQRCTNKNIETIED